MLYTSIAFRWVLHEKCIFKEKHKQHWTIKLFSLNYFQTPSEDQLEKIFHPESQGFNIRQFSQNLESNVDEGQKFYHPLAVASEPNFGDSLLEAGNVDLEASAGPGMADQQPAGFMTPQPVQGGRPISVFQVR